MKSINFVIKKVIEDNPHLPPDQIKTVITEYWNKVYDQFLSLDDTTIALRGIGVLTISKFKLNKYIRKRITKIKFTKKRTDIAEDKKQTVLEHHYNRLRKALKQRNELAKMYKHD